MDARTLDVSVVSAAKWARIERYLESLPIAAAVKLFETLEAARLRPSVSSGGEDLPYDAMIAVLRSVIFDLGATFPTRRPTAKRAFFEPIEDFLTPLRRGRKRRGRIPRTSLNPIWHVLTTDDPRGEFNAAAAALQAALDAEADSAVVSNRRSDLFAAARERIAQLIAAASADDDARRALTGRLGGGQAGAASAHDLAELGSLLSIAPQLEALQTLFPKPIAQMTEADLFEVRRLYADASAAAPDAAGGVFLCLIGRSPTPWRALRLYLHLKRADDPALPNLHQDADSILELLFEDLESLARALERDASEPLDATDAAARLQYFSDYAAGLIGEAQSAGETVIVNRAEASRDVAAAACMRASEQAAARVRAAMPTRRAGGSSRLTALRPAIVDDHGRVESSDAALSAADFLARAEGLSVGLGRSDIVRAKIIEVREEVRRYCADLVIEIRAAEGEERRRAKRQMERVLKIAGPLVPAEDIALLAEKAAAAAVSA